MSAQRVVALVWIGPAVLVGVGLVTASLIDLVREWLTDRRLAAAGMTRDDLPVGSFVGGRCPAESCDGDAFVVSPLAPIAMCTTCELTAHLSEWSIPTR